MYVVIKDVSRRGNSVRSRVDERSNNGETRIRIGPYTDDATYKGRKEGKKGKERRENGRRWPARERGRTRVWKSRYLVSGGPRVAAERNLDIGSPGGMKSRWASLGELFVVEGQSHVRSQLGRRKKETKRRKEREDSREPEREKERYVPRVAEEGGRAEGGTKWRKSKRKKEGRKDERAGVR